MDIPQKTSYGRKMILFIAVAVIILIAVGAAAYYFMSDRAPEDQSQAESQTNEEQLSEDQSETIAKVNDYTITKEMLNERIGQLTAAGQIPPLLESSQEEAAIKKAVLEQMLTEQLLINDATAQGISVSSNDVNQRYSEIQKEIAESDSEQNLLQLLEEENITVEEYKESLRRQLIIENYVDKLKNERNVVVTDEEIRKFFDEQVKPQNEAIVFEDVAEQIKNQLEQQQISEFLPTIIDRLKSEADVQNLL